MTVTPFGTDFRLTHLFCFLFTRKTNLARSHFLFVLPRAAYLDDYFETYLPGLANAYVALVPNDYCCGEQLGGAWEVKFETSKSGSLIIAGSLMRSQMKHDEMLVITQ